MKGRSSIWYWNVDMDLFVINTLLYDGDLINNYRSYRQLSLSPIHNYHYHMTQRMDWVDASPCQCWHGLFVDVVCANASRYGCRAPPHMCQSTPLIIAPDHEGQKLHLMLKCWDGLVCRYGCLAWRAEAPSDVDMDCSLMWCVQKQRQVHPVMICTTYLISLKST